jgi:hypothetical protein
MLQRTWTIANASLPLAALVTKIVPSAKTILSVGGQHV